MRAESPFKATENFHPLRPPPSRKIKTLVRVKLFSVIIMYLDIVNYFPILSFYLLRAAPLQNYRDFSSISNRGSNPYPYDLHHHTIITTPPKFHFLRRREIRYLKKEEIRRIVAS